MSNSIVIKGNATADGVIRYAASGDGALTFTIADNQGFGDNKTVTFWRVTMWGKRGESVAPYVLKGSQLCVIGEASAKSYTDKQGIEKLSLEVRANDIWLIGSKESAPGKPQRSSSGGQPDFDEPPF